MPITKRQKDRGRKLHTQSSDVDMPAATGTKRVKNKRISRAFIIGSEAWPLPPVGDPKRDPSIPEDHKKGWKVYVKPVENGPDITAWLKKVQFNIWHTYTNPHRMVESAPFEVHETGWGGFTIDVKLFFQPISNEKPCWRSHILQLEPYGTDEDKAQQDKTGRVISEQVEIVEFNEPTEALWDALTDDRQWDHLNKSGAKEKSKARASLAAGGVDGVERSVDMPETAPPGSLWSKQIEEAHVDFYSQITRKIKELEERERGKLEELLRRKAELTESGELPTKKK